MKVEEAIKNAIHKINRIEGIYTRCIKSWTIAEQKEIIHELEYGLETIETGISSLKVLAGLGIVVDKHTYESKNGDILITTIEERDYTPLILFVRFGEKIRSLVKNPNAKAITVTTVEPIDGNDFKIKVSQAWENASVEERLAMVRAMYVNWIEIARKHLEFLEMEI